MMRRARGLLSAATGTVKAAKAQSSYGASSPVVVRAAWPTQRRGSHRRDDARRGRDGERERERYDSAPYNRRRYDTSDERRNGREYAAYDDVGSRYGARERDWRDRDRGRKRSNPEARGEFLYGLSPVRAALLNFNREHYRLYVQEGLGGDLIELRERVMQWQQRRSGDDAPSDVAKDENDAGAETPVRRRRRKAGKGGNGPAELVGLAIDVHGARIIDEQQVEGSYSERRGSPGRGAGPHSDGRWEYDNERQYGDIENAFDDDFREGPGASFEVLERSKHMMNQMTDNRPHQGIILDCSPMEPTVVDTIDIASANVPASGSKKRLFVALDEVQDPHNLGALLRSALFLGVDGVVVCGRNSAPLSPAVAKSSAGALDHMHSRLFSIRSMPRFLSNAVENGWDVIGTDTDAAAVDVNELETGDKTILVLGNEGSGLRHLVAKACSRHVMIEQAGAGADGGSLNVHSQYTSHVDSLNVSVAGAILMHACCRQTRS